MKIFSFCLIFGVLFGLVMTAKPRRSAKRTVRGLKTSKQNGEFDGLSADTVALIKELRKMMNKCHGRKFCWLDFIFSDIIVRVRIQSLLSVNFRKNETNFSETNFSKLKNMSIEIFQEFQIAKLTTRVRPTSTPEINVPKSLRRPSEYFGKAGRRKFSYFKLVELTDNYVCIWCWLEHKKTESAVQTSVNFRANVISATFK